MIKESIKITIYDALKSWFTDNNLGDIDFNLEIPPKEFESDLSLNIAMSAAKRVKKNPKAVAEEIIAILKESADLGIISDYKIAGSGFINLNLSNRYFLEKFASLVNSGFSLGGLENEKVCIEFVSANPTGPLHVGHGRGAAIGDSLARIYKRFGADVTREYYVNNIGNQIGILGRSLESRVKESKGEEFSFPEDGYKGGYVKDIARMYLDGNSGSDYTEFAYKTILGIIKNDLEKFNVHFDVWTFENTLHDSGLMDETLVFLKQKGALFEKDGALWLGSTSDGDEKDRVVKRSDGRYTYLASDMAYHKNKIERGFSRLVDIWGADHYGYKKRLEYVLKMLDFNPRREIPRPLGRGESICEAPGRKPRARGDEFTPEKFNIILYQLVRLMREGKVVSMSTRSGEFVTLEDVVSEVGSDACRFNFLLRSPQSHLDFDLELAKKHSSENPVYYVQYAHARICSIFAEANIRGVVYKSEKPSPDYFANKQERELLKQVVFFPDVLNSCLKDSTPHYITAYLIETVKKFHTFYDNCRVLGADEKTTQSRLYLISGIKHLIAAGLDMLGVSAPDKM